jgi:hypothetical protein
MKEFIDYFNQLIGGTIDAEEPGICVVGLSKCAKAIHVTKAVKSGSDKGQRKSRNIEQETVSFEKVTTWKIEEGLQQA